MANFVITHKIIEDNIDLIKGKGFLDAHTFERMEEKINNLFADGRFKIVVDLNNVGYISSAGAGVFIASIALARSNGGDIVFLKPSPNVQEVFDLLGLSQIFIIAPDLESALKSFKKEMV